MTRMLGLTRRVIKITALFIVILATTVFWLGDQQITGVFVAVLVLLFVGAVVGTIPIVDLYRTDPEQPPNWLVLADAAAQIAKCIGLFLLLVIVIRPYIGIEAFPPGVGRHLLGMSLVLICMPISAKGVLYWLARRKTEVA